MPHSPRILHLNDCAFVGRNIVDAASRAGYRWDYLEPGKTWPAVSARSGRPGKPAIARTLVRRVARITAAQVLHVHFATTARILRAPYIPRRPYVLHLHGTDIRSLWAADATHSDIQRIIDGAAHVFYSTRDNQQNAEAARPDAEYLPVFVDPTSLPRWQTNTSRRRVLFVSRWEEVKGLADQLALARAVAESTGRDVELVGLDWGLGANEARGCGVHLVPKQSHTGFLQLLATADVAVGQATSILSVSEIEAMAIGVPLAAPAPHLPGPDGQPVPIMGGTVDEVAEQIITALDDPVATSRRLGSRAWALREHTADRYIPSLLRLYRKLAAAG